VLNGPLFECSENENSTHTTDSKVKKCSVCWYPYNLDLALASMSPTTIGTTHNPKFCAHVHTPYAVPTWSFFTESAMVGHSHHANTEYTEPSCIVAIMGLTIIIVACAIDSMTQLIHKIPVRFPNVSIKCPKMGVIIDDVKNISPSAHPALMFHRAGSTLP